MRVVLDTGILIAALITSDTPPALIYQAWRKNRFQLITSTWQLDEFRRASRYPKLRRYINPAEPDFRKEFNPLMFGDDLIQVPTLNC